MKIKNLFLKTPRVFLAALLTATPAIAEVTVIGSTTTTMRETSFSLNFPANTADKLVVVVTGEHGFNNAAGALTSLTYDGVELTEAVYRNAQVAGSDILYHGIWYLDNPATSEGLINFEVVNRGTVSAFLLTGTAEGHGASGITEVGERSISLTTTQTGSLVLAAFGVGGDGNTGNTDSIDTDAPLVEVSAVKDPSNWQGHVVGVQAVAAPSANTFSFAGGTETGAVVAAAEFLSAGGTAGLPFSITEIFINGVSNEVTLTWPKTGAASYIVKVSTDLEDWSVDLDDGITPDLDEMPEDDLTITVTLPLPEDLEGSPKLFFRVEEGS